METGFQEQYKFIYDTLEEYCRGIDSRFPVSELANQIKEKTLKDKKLKKNAYAIEYSDQAQGSIEIIGDPTTLLRIRSDIFALINSIKKFNPKQVF